MVTMMVGTTGMYRRDVCLGTLIWDLSTLERLGVDFGDKED